jgi:hypothetical protein
VEVAMSGTSRVHAVYAAYRARTARGASDALGAWVAFVVGRAVEPLDTTRREVRTSDRGDPRCEDRGRDEDPMDEPVVPRVEIELGRWE